MKGAVIIFCAVLVSSAAFSQPGEWVWLHGLNGPGSGGNFGIQGVSSPGNMPPATYESCEWTDLSGNFWLFGGLTGGFGEYGDLWKYNPLSNEWTWMKGTGVTGDPGNYGTMGIPSPANNPPSRAWGMASWVDNQGRFWMYGGYGISIFSDLWMYDPSTNEWTWMNGPGGGGWSPVYGTQGVPDPANIPGSRYECATAWTDNSGDLWLFGGYSGGGGFNDLWRYNIVSNEWTWMKGSPLQGASNVYGMQGVEDPANTPGARQAYCHWKEVSGNLWMFSGYDYSNGTLYNDMWRYNPATNNWAWIMGGTGPGIYNTQCQPDSSNIPTGRFENRASVTDQNGDFWLFGGGEGSSFQNTYNDLWKYCVSTGQWTWISGDNSSNPAGNWGTLGVSSPLNKPQGRGGTVAWSDQNGHIYLFGGTDQFWPSMYNDLWKFTIDPNCAICSSVPQAIFTAPNHICPGTCTDFTNLSVNATSYQWNFQGANPSVSTDVNPVNICYNTPGSFDVTLIASNAVTSDTITLSNYITVYPYPPPQGITQAGDTLYANAGAVSYQWYHDGNPIAGATDYFYVASESGNYNIVATDANGCEVEAAIFDVVASTMSEVSDFRFEVYPNPAEDFVTVGLNSSDLKDIRAFGEISVYNVMGETVLNPKPDVNRSMNDIQLDISGLSAGLYLLEIKYAEKIFRSRFVKK